MGQRIRLTRPTWRELAPFVWMVADVHFEPRLQWIYLCWGCSLVHTATGNHRTCLHFKTSYSNVHFLTVWLERPADSLNLNVATRGRVPTFVFEVRCCSSMPTGTMQLNLFAVMVTGGILHPASGILIRVDYSHSSVQMFRCFIVNSSKQRKQTGAPIQSSDFIQVWWRVGFQTTY